MSEALTSLESSRQQRGQLQAEIQAAQMTGDVSSAQRLQEQLAGNRAEFQMTINRLRSEDPDFERLLSVRPSSFSKLQGSLPSDAVLVAYYPSAEKMVIFAATQKELRIFSSPLGRQELTQKVGDLRRQIVRLKPLDQKLVKSLYQDLIGPLEPLLKDRNMLTVIPSGVLYYLPFSILKASEDSLLSKTHGLSLITATELPDVGQYQRGEQPETLLAFADPDGSLPSAAAEVRKVSTLFKDPKSYFGPDVTKDRVKGPSDILHFATHGILNSRDVNQSYLMVAGDDRRLTTGEIYGLDLSGVSLVTLSACQTAIGEVNPGAEVATLAQAFSIAGSRSMLGTLWSVDDDATAFFMSEFYTHFLAGKSKVEALRLAQNSVRSEPRWQHPYFWGAFTLIGDWN